MLKLLRERRFYPAQGLAAGDLRPYEEELLPAG